MCVFRMVKISTFFRTNIITQVDVIIMHLCGAHSNAQKRVFDSVV